LIDIIIKNKDNQELKTIVFEDLGFSVHLAQILKRNNGNTKSSVLNT
jgi:hypothetical protein